MIGVRPLIAALVCAVLIVTAQGMAFARGQPPAEGRIVLCTGHGAVVVYVDTDGVPTSPPELCADAFAVFSALASPKSHPFVSALSFTAYADTKTRDVFLFPELPAFARGPPLV